MTETIMLASVMLSTPEDSWNVNEDALMDEAEQGSSVKTRITG